MIKGKKLIYLAGIAIIAVVACGVFILSGGYSSVFGPQQVDHLTIVTAQTTASVIVGDVVKQYHIDTKHNLDLTITTALPGDLERRYFNGEFTVATMGVLTAAAGYKQGVPTTIVGPALPITYQIAVRNDSPIHSLKDLKGRVLGVLPRATAAYPAVAAVLQSAGINPAKDVTLYYGSVPDLNKRLLSGEIDAAIVSYPLGASLYATGKIREVANLETVWEQAENGLPLPFVVIAVRSDWYLTHKNVVNEYIATWREATQMLIDHPEIVDQFTDYLTSQNLNTPTALALLHQNLPSMLMASWGSREVDGVTRFFNRSVQYGLIDASTTPPVIVR